MEKGEFLLGVAAVAEYLDVHYNTAYKLVTNGTLPATKVGAQWRVRISDVDQYIYDSSRKSTKKVDLPEIIAIVNQKGGVGKSTLTINLSEALTLLDQKVLFIDMDPQSNSSTGVGIKAEGMAINTITEVLIDELPLHEAIFETEFGFDVVPATIALSEVEMDLIMRIGRESILANSIIKSQNELQKYDYIFIDCPPSLSILTINALTAATSCIIPVAVSKFSLEGVKLLMKTISSIRQINKDLYINKFVITMADLRSNTAKDFIKEMPQIIQQPFAKTAIRKLNAVSEAQFADKPISAYAPKSEAAQEVLELAKEVLKASEDRFRGDTND